MPRYHLQGAVVAVSHRKFWGFRAPMSISSSFRCTKNTLTVLNAQESKIQKKKHNIDKKMQETKKKNIYILSEFILIAIAVDRICFLLVHDLLSTLSWELGQSMLGHARARHLCVCVLAARWFLADRNTIDRWQICCQKRRPWRGAKHVCVGCTSTTYPGSCCEKMCHSWHVVASCSFFLPVNTTWTLVFPCLCALRTYSLHKDSHLSRNLRFPYRLAESQVGTFNEQLKRCNG